MRPSTRSRSTGRARRLSPSLIRPRTPRTSYCKYRASLVSACECRHDFLKCVRISGVSRLARREDAATAPQPIQQRTVSEQHSAAAYTPPKTPHSFAPLQLRSITFVPTSRSVFRHAAILAAVLGAAAAVDPEELAAAAAPAAGLSIGLLSNCGWGKRKRKSRQCPLRHNRSERQAHSQLHGDHGRPSPITRWHTLSS